MAKHLTNYLRTHRKRAGLTQDEVAYLLGGHAGSKVSRYERFRREPNLRTVLAYQVIFNVPARELFAGVFDEIERKTLQRIGRLARKLHSGTPSPLKDHKLETLANAVRASRLATADDNA